MRPFKSSIFWAKTTSLCLFLVVLLCIWVAPALVAADNGEFQHPNPPLREGSAPKPFTWDNDLTVATGSVEGGISIDSDTSGNLYAVRCTTGGDFRIYKSTDGGKNWSDIATVVAPAGSSYPVILTGSTGNKLHLFYLSSSQDGDIWMYSIAQDGEGESYEVKVDSDTITYFSACTDMGRGDYLMVAFQRERMGYLTPEIYTTVSTDQGESWSDGYYITGDGSHPDIAYGNGGYVYLVYEKYLGGPDQEIGFIRSDNYGAPASWKDRQYLTSDSYDDTYPRVAALHTLPDSTPYVWVAYNQENLAHTDIDLAYAYSCNGGKDWSKNHILDSTSACHEMACDLWTKRSPDYHNVHVCYFVGRYVLPFPHGHIYYGSASATNPTDWGWLFSPTNHWPTQSEDGRKVCQGTFAPGNYGFVVPAIMYAGKDPDEPFGDNFRNLWFDNSAWPVDVEEEMTEEGVPAEFSLSPNYPNPFNPQTRISYFIPEASRVRLEIFNILGQRIKTLVDEEQAAGRVEVSWDGTDKDGNDVASGVYLYKLEAGNSSQSNKMVLMR